MRFKDRHLFPHRYASRPRPLPSLRGVSEEITELAEVIVCAAVRLAWNELVAEHGTR